MPPIKSLDEIRAELFQQEQEREDRNRAPVNDPKPIEAKGAEHWLKKIFPKHFSKPFAKFHQEYWKHAWNVEPEVAPDPMALCLFRSGGKSQSIEGTAVMWGARRIRKYILYFSGTQDQANSHVLSIQRMLKSSQVAKYYPDLAEAEVNEYGDKASWNRQRLWTKHGFIIDALGLNSAVRGAKLDELRPDAIIIDDIDDKHDSMLVVMDKIAVISADILPCGTDECATIFAQNLIHSNSVMSQVISDEPPMLRTRKVIGPVPMVRNFAPELVAGARKNSPKKYILPQTNGANRPSWAGNSIATCEKRLNESNLAEFLREYQQDTSVALEGLIYKGYVETHHIVRKCEVVAAYKRLGCRVWDDDGNFMVPYHWQKQMGHDYGYSIEHPSVFRWATRPGQYDPFPDIVMWYRERCVPKYPHRKGDVVLPASPIRNAKMIREIEAPWAEGDNMNLRVMSHEQSAAASTYNLDEEHFSGYDGLQFQKVKPDARGGIAQMQNFLEIDYTRTHPFRCYPQGYMLNGEDVSGKPLLGRPRMIYLVDDDQGALYVDDENTLCVQRPRDDNGFIRMRDERPKYINVRGASGLEQNKPVSIFNDSHDAERFLSGRTGSFFIESTEPTHSQAREMSLDARHRIDAIAEAPEHERPLLMAERQLEMALYDKENAEENYIANAVRGIYQRRRNAFR